MWHWQTSTLHFKSSKKHQGTDILEMDPMDPHISPIVSNPQQLISSSEATSRCTAWALQGIKRTTVWAPRNVAWQSTVSMLSDEHVKWQMPWEAPIGARCRKKSGLVKSQGERKGGKVPKKWGMLCGWFVFSIFVGVQVLLFNMLGTFSKHRGQARPSTRWYVSFFGGLGPGK